METGKKEQKKKELGIMNLRESKTKREESEGKERKSKEIGWLAGGSPK